MKINIKKLALIISGILLIPAAGYAHTEAEIDEFRQKWFLTGRIVQSCSLFEENWLSRDKASLIVGEAINRMGDNFGANTVYGFVEKLNQEFPTCKYAYPERFRQ